MNRTGLRLSLALLLLAGMLALGWFFPTLLAQEGELRQAAIGWVWAGWSCSRPRSLPAVWCWSRPRC